MDNKIGLFIALLGFVALFISLVSNTSNTEKSVLVIIFTVVMGFGIMLEVFKKYFTERVDFG